MAKILIIDDDPIHGDMTKQRMERAGHQVTVHVGPFGATNAAADEQLDLILLDVFMPALPGPDLLDIMRKKNQRARSAVVFCSSMDPTPLARLALEHGADGFISKSAGREAFLRTIDSVLLERSAKLARNR
jgi:DNA-binding NarL/FixJ family response regulator